MEREKKLPLENEMHQQQDTTSKSGYGGVDLLDKKMASFMQTATKEDNTVD